MLRILNNIQTRPLESERSPGYECDECKDTDLVYVGPKDVRPCLSCRRRKRIARIPKIYRDVSLETMQPDSWRHPMQADFLTYVRDQPDISYFLEGRAGTGKSHFAWAIVRHAIDADRRVVIAITLTELIAQYRRFIEDKTVEPDIVDYKLRKSEADHTILIDDVDKANPTEYVGQEVFNLLNVIHEQGHQLIVTSNLDSDQLTDFYEEKRKGRGEAIVRRMIEDVKILKFWR